MHYIGKTINCQGLANKFPERKLKNGKDVVEYPDLIQFIMEKDDYETYQEVLNQLKERIAEEKEK